MKFRNQNWKLVVRFDGAGYKDYVTYYRTQREGQRAARNWNEIARKIATRKVTVTLIDVRKDHE